MRLNISGILISRLKYSCFRNHIYIRSLYEKIYIFLVVKIVMMIYNRYINIVKGISLNENEKKKERSGKNAELFGLFYK